MVIKDKKGYEMKDIEQIIKRLNELRGINARRHIDKNSEMIANMIKVSVSHLDDMSVIEIREALKG